MFNLFPKKKSVDEIVEDVDVTPAWQWTPTQTPSMLQAQNELIEQFLKENAKLKVENDDLRNKWLAAEATAVAHKEDAETMAAAVNAHKKKIVELESKADLDFVDWKAQQETNEELVKEIKNLRRLKEENVDLMEILSKYNNGYKGSCYACEPVGELNQKLELQIKEYQKIVEGGHETIKKLKEEIEKYKTSTTYIFNEYDLIRKENPTHTTSSHDYLQHWGGYENNWEQATGDLALRVVKLEKQISQKKPEFLNCACGDCHDKTEKYNQEQENNNPLYKHC